MTRLVKAEGGTTDKMIICNIYIFSLQDKTDGGVTATVDLTGLFTEFSILSLEVWLDLVKIQYILVFITSRGFPLYNHWHETWHNLQVSYWHHVGKPYMRQWKWIGNSNVISKCTNRILSKSFCLLSFAVTSRPEYHHWLHTLPLSCWLRSMCFIARLDPSNTGSEGPFLTSWNYLTGLVWLGLLSSPQSHPNCLTSDWYISVLFVVWNTETHLYRFNNSNGS